MVGWRLEDEPCRVEICFDGTEPEDLKAIKPTNLISLEENQNLNQEEACAQIHRLNSISQNAPDEDSAARRIQNFLREKSSKSSPSEESHEDQDQSEEEEEQSLEDKFPLGCTVEAHSLVGAAHFNGFQNLIFWIQNFN